MTPFLVRWRETRVAWLCAWHVVLLGRMFTGLVLDEGKAAALWARSEALVRQALDGEGEGEGYDWPDPLKVLGTAAE